MKQNRAAVPLFFVLCILFSDNANAYIDPGTGSLLIQGLIAGVAAGLYAVKQYWYKLKKFFSHSEDKLDVDPDENDQ